MAGFFGLFDYAKPGKGVDVDAPPKKPFFRFFELLWRKLSRFVILNMLVFVFLLPVITLAFQAYYSWYYSILPEEVIEEMVLEMEQSTEENPIVVFGIMQSAMMSVTSALPFPVSVALVVLSAVFYGPVMCGLSYILRNFTREEHAWLSDFFVHMKKNFKQGAVLGALELFAVVMLLYNITAQAAEGATDWIAVSLPAIKYVSVFLLVIIMFVRNYLYIIAVTFNLRLIDIIKNSFAFAIIGLGRNFFVLLIDIISVLAILFIPYLDIILVPFLFISFLGFLSVFACYPLIHKHMLIPALERKKAEEEQS